ncbi:uncharacterized protein PRCAT00006013001 [Priceomyces carsonii]|uniref:uncharacterized protein n=1 Tax=Priceomyces carsonii TaxID=28549 RepID=UPI002EDB9435|nr:unnamed protein product [Priceomyces carsonii]
MVTKSMEVGVKKRERVPKACNFCRRRKIKCDGKSPCLHCATSNSNECIYSSNSDRKNKPSKSPTERRNGSSSSVDYLESKVEKLEKLILNLANRIDSPNSNNQIDSVSTNSPDSVHGSSESLLGGTSKENDQKVPSTQIFEQYFGTQTTFHIFSNKSIAWIKNKLGPEKEDLCIPIGNMPAVFQNLFNSVLDLFVDPKVELEEKSSLLSGSFPITKELVFELLDVFDKIYLAGFLCEASSIKALFDIYYEDRKHFGSRHRRLKSSELLIMNISLALALSSALESDRKHNSSLLHRLPIFSSLSSDELLGLQTKFFRNSVFYYHRVSTVSDGILSIQAILLLAFYLEMNWLHTSVNYILTSVAIRFAQEIGLHRYESLTDLPEAEIVLRRKTWLFCQLFDTENCYRGGKPPIINYSDVSTLTSKDDSHFTNLQEMSFNIQIDASCDDDLNLVLALNKIRAKSYCDLFSASVNHETFSSISKTIRSLNQEMFLFVEKFDDSCRPRFYNDKFFESKTLGLFRDGPYGRKAELALTIQLSFFIHLMTINGLPFQVQFPDHDENCIESIVFRNLKLDSARTVLRIVKGLEVSKIRSDCLEWNKFYPYSAFLILLGNCLNRPNSPDIEADFRLLSDVSMNFFVSSQIPPMDSSLNHSQTHSTALLKNSLSINNQKKLLSHVVLRTMLNILFVVLERETHHNFLSDIKGLKEHLNESKKHFPELFVERPLYALPKHILKFSEANSGSSRKVSTDLGISDGIFNRQVNTPLSYGMGSDEELSSINPSRSRSFTSFPTSDNGLPRVSSLDEMNDDTINNMFYSQIYNLPNFFFDNNMGT